MIDLDLADAVSHAGPPPGHLLAPAVVLLVLLPLGLAGALYEVRTAAESQTRAIDEQLATLSGRAAEEQAARLRMQRLQSSLDGAQALQESASAMIALTLGVSQHFGPGMRLAELSIDADAIRVTGSARSAGDVSLWLGRSAGRDAALIWEAPEIRNTSTGPGGVDFKLRVRRVAGAAPAGQR